MKTPIERRVAENLEILHMEVALLRRIVMVLTETMPSASRAKALRMIENAANLSPKFPEAFPTDLDRATHYMTEQVSFWVAILK